MRLFTLSTLVFCLACICGGGTEDDTGSSRRRRNVDDDDTADTGTTDTGANDTGATDTGYTVATDAPGDWTLDDLNPDSPRYGEPVSPRDYISRVSGYYFIHST